MMRNDDGTTPLASPECTPSVEDLDAQRAADQPAQRRGHPQPLVVEAARVEAQHEARRADAVGERLEVGGQVGAAALLAGLDQHDAAGVAQAVRLRGLDGAGRDANAAYPSSAPPRP